MDDFFSLFNYYYYYYYYIAGCGTEYFPLGWGVGVVKWGDV